MIGVIDKFDPTRCVPLAVTYMPVFQPDLLPPQAFHLIAIGGGSPVLEVDGVSCPLTPRSVLCLHDQNRIELQSGHATEVWTVSFSPVFLNVNMTPAFLRSPQYHNLCDAHAFFQLSPFLAEDNDKRHFTFDPETFARILASIGAIEQNVTEQPDWYWSCRARSYLIDILTALERTFNDYYLPLFANSLNVARIQQEFREVLMYINNHLQEKLTMQQIYTALRINRNRLTAMFRENLGETFKEYVDRRRFEEASYYLRFTNLKGEEIAHRLGFATGQYFSRFFTRMAGQPPEDFRREKVTRRKLDMAELHRIEQTSRGVREQET